MKRSPLYSAARPRAPQPAPAPAQARASRLGLKSFLSRHERPLLIAAGGLLAALLVAVHAALAPAPRQITQRDIDRAVRHSLETNPLPSRSAQAYEAVAPAVVRVQGVRRLESLSDPAAVQSEGSTGSGVVVHDSGLILTSLHVIEGTDSIAVDFATGERSEAEVISVQPENDLAVLRAKTVPDDLVAATLGAAADLRPG